MNLANVETNVVAHLAAALQNIKVKSYTGEFDDDDSQRISFKAPTLFVSFLGAEFKPSPSGELISQTRWAGFLILHQAQRQAKNEKQLLSSVLGALNLSSLGLAALPIELKSFEQILSRQLEKSNLSAWVIRWQQSLKLLTPAADEDKQFTVLNSHEPRTGTEHIGQYKRVE